MLRPFLVLLALLAASASAAAQPGWTHVCQSTPWDAEAMPYALTSSAPADGCIWTHRETGETVQALPDEISLYLRDLAEAANWLTDNGFRAPRLKQIDGEWAVLVVPRGSAACYDGVCQPIDGGEGALLTDTRTDPAEAVLAVDADKLVTGGRGSYYALMLATQMAYEGFEAGAYCEPECWISLGTAAGFARWWWWRTTGEDRPVAPRFGRALQTDAATASRQDGIDAGAFWHSVAFPTSSYQGGFLFAQELYERLGSGEEPIDVVDAVLGQPAYGDLIGPPSGLSNRFASFVVFHFQRTALAPEEDVVTVPRGETETRYIAVHDPLAAVLVPVEIPDVDGVAAVTVRVKEANESIAFSIGNETDRALVSARVEANGEREWGLNTAKMCPSGEGPCRFTVALSNADPERASDTAEEDYLVEVAVQDLCALPDGANGVTFAVEGPDPESGARTALAEIAFDLKPMRRRRGMAANDVSGRVALTAGPLPIATDFDARMTCDAGGFALADLTFRNEALNVVAGSLGATVQGTRLELPASVQIGDALPDVIQDTEFGPDGEAAIRSGGWLHDLRVTGQERRRVRGLPGSLQVWKVEGLLSSGMETDGAVMTNALERAGVEVDGDVERGAQDALRGAGLEANSDRRQTMGGLFGALEGEEENRPVVIYYSPAYGAVETVSGVGAEAVTSRLVEVRREE